MGYDRKYRTTGRDRRRRRRATAAVKLQRWARRGKRRRTGLAGAVALSNRKAIKTLKSTIETNYAVGKLCTLANQLTGQHLITDVDAVGFCNTNMTTPTWTGTPPVMTGPVYDTFNWRPLIMKPLYIPQSTTGTSVVGTRQGNEVQLKWISIKGNVSAYPAIYNGKGQTTGYNYNARPMRQRVRIYVIHDSDPSVDRLQTSYSESLTSNTLYLMNNTPAAWGVNPWIPSLPGQFSRANQYIRNGPDAGSGGAVLADYSHWAESTSFFERDFVNTSGKDSQNHKRRFKVLKTIDVGPLRQEECQGGDGGGTVPSSKNFACTLKLPYKLLFKAGSSVLPCNQQILIMAVSNVVCGGTAAGAVNDTQYPPYRCPRLEIQCKLAYTDA